MEQTAVLHVRGAWRNNLKANLSSTHLRGTGESVIWCTILVVGKAPLPLWCEMLAVCGQNLGSTHASSTTYPVNSAYPRNSLQNLVGRVEENENISKYYIIFYISHRLSQILRNIPQYHGGVADVLVDDITEQYGIVLLSSLFCFKLQTHLDLSTICLFLLLFFLNSV